LWYLLDTTRANCITPPGTAEAIETRLTLTPQGEPLATIQSSAQWMREVGEAIRDCNLDNSSAVLIGAQQQIFAMDESPRARLGETVDDPCAEEFPVQVFRAAKTTARTRMTRMRSPTPPTDVGRPPFSGGKKDLTPANGE